MNQLVPYEYREIKKGDKARHVQLYRPVLLVIIYLIYTPASS